MRYSCPAYHAKRPRRARARSATCRDHPCADLALEDVHLGAELRIDGDQLLDEIEIVAGLVFVVCYQITIVSLHAFRDHELIQSREPNIGRFVVLFRAAGQTRN